MRSRTGLTLEETQFLEYVGYVIVRIALFQDLVAAVLASVFQACREL
jgi:hypothetical protein